MINLYSKYKYYYIVEIPEIFAARPDQEEAEEAEKVEEEAGDDDSKISNKGEENKEEPELVECEHSLEEEDSPDPQNLIDFNIRSKTEVETLENAGSPLKARLIKSEENKGVQSNPHLNRGSVKLDEIQEEKLEQQKRLSLDIHHINGNYQSSPEKGGDGENEIENENKDSTGFGKLFTKEVLKAAKPRTLTSKKKDYFAFNDEESSVAQGNDLTQKEISVTNLKRDISRPFDQSQEGGNSVIIIQQP